jgi:hypothetical protein
MQRGASSAPSESRPSDSTQRATNRSPEPRSHSAPQWVAFLVFVGYFIIARVTVNLFPFSTFSMFAGLRPGAEGESRGCQLLAMGGDGRAVDVTEFSGWECPPWQDVARRSIDELSCDAHGNVENHVRDYLERGSRSSGEKETVRLIRRLWIFRSDGSGETSDHLIASCRASR